MSDINIIQAGLLQDAIRIGEFQAEIISLESFLDDPRSEWNLRQSRFQNELTAARKRHAETQAAAAAEAERNYKETLAKQPLLQTIWEIFLARANNTELAVMSERNRTYGVGWWLDIPSPFFLDLSSDPVKALVSSAFRAIRLSRFESHLRNKKSRLSQFRQLKKFPSESGILTFLETSESKSYGLTHVLTRPDAEASVNFLLHQAAYPFRADSSSATTKENSHDPAQFR